MEENNIKEKITIHERLTRVEEQICQIMENHLPHMQRGVDDLNTKFWGVIILLIANLVAVLTGKI